MSGNSGFSDLLRHFNDNHVRYLVIGGYALIQYAAFFDLATASACSAVSITVDGLGSAREDDFCLLMARVGQNSWCCCAVLAGRPITP